MTQNLLEILFIFKQTSAYLEYLQIGTSVKYLLFNKSMIINLDNQGLFFLFLQFLFDLKKQLKIVDLFLYFIIIRL